HADRPAEAGLACETGMELSERFYNLKAGAYRPLGIIVMGLWIAKVDDDFLTAILGDMALKMLDDAGARLLVGTDHGIEVFRIQVPGQWEICHKFAKHDGELAPFSVGHPREGHGDGTLGRRLVRRVSEHRGSQGVILPSSVWQQRRSWGLESQRHDLVLRGRLGPFLHRRDEAIA